MLTDIEISRKAKLIDIREVAEKILIKEENLELYGKNKAKISKNFLEKIEKQNQKTGKLILVTACNPIPAWEGKTTTTIWLGQAFWKLGKKSLICLREPSLWPVFWVKWWATWWGYSQVVPMEDINLHFTWDFHAITSAHLLLSAAIDNHIYFWNELQIDLENIVWKRAFDVNDRALRNFSYSSDWKNSLNISSGAMITTASEIMAIFCLASDIFDLKKRLSEIIFAYDVNWKPLKVKDLKIEGSLTALLKDAIKPNLVQTLENTPCLIHGWPFANIAHGCNSLIATKTALQISDYVVTEAWFGSDLGAQKFFDIKCRIWDIKPDAVILVSTLNSIKYNAWVTVSNLKIPNVEILEKWIVNLQKHIENIKKYNLPVIVCLNKFWTDTKEEIDFVKNFCEKNWVSFEIWEWFAKWWEWMTSLANKLVQVLENSENNFKFLYEDDIYIKEKIEKICKEIYWASNVKYLEKVEKSIKNLEENWFSSFPICIAKTPVSLSDNPKLLWRPKDFEITISDLQVSAWAWFIVAFAWDIMTMPGLSKVPNATKIDIDEFWEIIWLN